MSTPYSVLAPEHWWQKSVGNGRWEPSSSLYRMKFGIGSRDRVATAGSCFAQHIATHMRANGYAVPNYEPAPPGLRSESARKFGYGIYSARYANIYVARHLLQLLREAWGLAENPEPVWTRHNRHFDSMRPMIEPDGHRTAAEVLAHRKYHLGRVRHLVTDMNVFVFTFGLTEGWIHRETGWAFPACPGTSGIGEFDEQRYAFKNFSYDEVLADFIAAREFILERNPSVRFIVTVSPVPLVATASAEHVLVATTYSKSVLRAVAGRLADQFEDVAYFPSYEIIASPPSRARYYEPDLREVTAAGVNAVMSTFFAAHGSFAQAAPGGTRAAEDVVCEEILLEEEAE